MSVAGGRVFVCGGSKVCGRRGYLPMSLYIMGIRHMGTPVKRMTDTFTKQLQETTTVNRPDYPRVNTMMDTDGYSSGSEGLLLLRWSEITLISIFIGGSLESP